MIEKLLSIQGLYVLMIFLIGSLQMGHFEKGSLLGLFKTVNVAQW
jgi:hypothetical protein